MSTPDMPATPRPYILGTLPRKIQQFIEATSSTEAFNQRSHTHRSLLNAYVVSTFLEEASQRIPPMKRDSGLRDLAQRLHLWPGDMAMDLQRDALKSIELLETYIQQALLTEITYVTRSNAEYAKKQVDEMTIAKNEALRDLHLLKVDLKEQILKHHHDFASEELDLHDLSPFIPGFKSARAKIPKSRIKIPPSPSDNAGELLVSSLDPGLLANSGISFERVAALASIERFREEVIHITSEFTDIIGHGSSKTLEKRIERMVNIQDAFEAMGTRLFGLLNSGGQRDYEDGTHGGEADAGVE